MSRVYLYSRVSTSDQSLAQQERTVYEWLHRHDMEVSKVYSDEGVSGGVSYKDRKLGKEVLPVMRAGDMLIVSEISRLGRSMFDLSKLIHEELKPRKIRLVVVGMGLDLRCDNLTAMDELILNNFSFAAQLEKQLISERTKSALAVKKSQGVKLGAASPKYIDNYNKLTETQKLTRNMRKGVMKRMRHQQSKDFVTFKKIIKKVFPEYTEAEDVKDWKWGYINMKRENREKVLELMKDYKELDNTGQLFRKFDFENDMEFCDARIHQYLQRFRNSCIGTTKEV